MPVCRFQNRDQVLFSEIPGMVCLAHQVYLAQCGSSPKLWGLNRMFPRSFLASLASHYCEACKDIPHTGRGTLPCPLLLTFLVHDSDDEKSRPTGSHRKLVGNCLFLGPQRASLVMWSGKAREGRLRKPAYVPVPQVLDPRPWHLPLN